jgi:hypothetical protein
MLTYDLLRQLKRPGAFCSNDAMPCYDLIGHPQASLSMQRVGVPRFAVYCMFSTLQMARHQVSMAFGDSTGTFGGPPFSKPIHGNGQENGSGLAIWAVVSSPLLDRLRASGVGAEFIYPLSSLSTSFVGYAFVDDSNLVVAKLSFSSFHEAANALKPAMDTWEQGITATSGAIVPEKTFTFLIDFSWRVGIWHYSTIAESPAQFFVNDIHGTRKLVKRYKPWEAQETLGVFLAPDRNLAMQFSSMLAKVQQWANALSTGNISRSEVWLALTTTIWQTLCYPLSSINLSRLQCEKLMSPLLQYALPALGICRSFPRDIVFALIKYAGLGIKHLHTNQEIARLKDILSHTTKGALLGDLYKHSLTVLLLELGLGPDLSQIDYNKFGLFCTAACKQTTIIVSGTLFPTPLNYLLVSHHLLPYWWFHYKNINLNSFWNNLPSILPVLLPGLNVSRLHHFPSSNFQRRGGGLFPEKSEPAKPTYFCLRVYSYQSTCSVPITFSTTSATGTIPSSSTQYN